jgi:hypothetical protein
MAPTYLIYFKAAVGIFIRCELNLYHYFKKFPQHEGQGSSREV